MHTHTINKAHQIRVHSDTTGLTDLQAKVYAPDGTLAFTVSLAEHNNAGTANEQYLGTFTPTVLGEHLVILVSPTDAALNDDFTIIDVVASDVDDIVTDLTAVATTVASRASSAALIIAQTSLDELGTELGTKATSTALAAAQSTINDVETATTNIMTDSTLARADIAAVNTDVAAVKAVADATKLAVDAIDPSSRRVGFIN